MGEKQIRNRWLTVRLSEEEYGLLEKYCNETTCIKLSDYVRRLVLKKPVNVKYRNISIDDFLKDMLQLKKDFNGVANNFNQSVHKLHTLQHLPEFHDWVMQNERDKVVILEKIETILSKVSQLYKTWSQS